MMSRMSSMPTDSRTKPGVTPGFRVLFPIPTNQIQANPLLTQNPGY